MCLDKIRPDMNRFEKGWKVFRLLSDGSSLSTLNRGNREKPLPENKWIHYRRWAERSGKIDLINDGLYPQGWHVEATEKGAMGWGSLCSSSRRRVLCRDMHTVGRQDGCKVGVCRWIKILPEGSDA